MSVSFGKISIIAILLLSVVFFTSCVGGEDKGSTNVVEKKGTIKNEVIKEEVVKNGTAKGVLSDYSAESLEKAEGTIVIFFHASWCGVCVKAKKDIIDKGVPENMTILIADFDTELELRKKYGVTVQTTFVEVTNDGTMIKKWQGGQLAKIIEETSK